MLIFFFIQPIECILDKTENNVFEFLLKILIICLLSIFKAFLPNSNAKPNVNAKKKN